MFKIPYVDNSVRDVFGNPSKVSIRLPDALGQVLSGLVTLHGKSPMLVGLEKVKYDFIYVPEIATSKCYFFDIIGLSKAFQFATMVWAESAGPKEYKTSMEIVRAFNMSRRLFQIGRRPASEEPVACIAAKQGVFPKRLPQKGSDGHIGENERYGVQEYEWNFGKARFEKAHALFKDLAGEKSRGWKKSGLPEGDTVELHCAGCYLKIRSRDGSRRFPHVRSNALRELASHRQRSFKVHGDLTQC